MNDPAVRTAAPPVRPHPGRLLVAVALGVAGLTLASRISVPMVPVPITLQTLALMLLGALRGWRRGMLTVLVWLGLAALGVPLLSGDAAGWRVFTGPTAGYLVSFPLVTGLVGMLAARGWDGRCPRRAFLAMLLAQALCLLVGAAWLATSLGPAKALTAGILPFLAGAVVKAALGALLLAAWRGLQVHSAPGAHTEA